jgi:hypothetical protein
MRAVVSRSAPPALVIQRRSPPPVAALGVGPRIDRSRVAISIACAPYRSPPCRKQQADGMAATVTRVHATLAFQSQCQEVLDAAVQLFVDRSHDHAAVRFLDMLPKTFKLTPGEFTVAFTVESQYPASASAARLDEIWEEWYGEYALGERPTHFDGPPAVLSAAHLFFLIIHEASNYAQCDIGGYLEGRLTLVAEESSDWTPFFTRVDGVGWCGYSTAAHPAPPTNPSQQLGAEARAVAAAGEVRAALRFAGDLCLYGEWRRVGTWTINDRNVFMVQAKLRRVDVHLEALAGLAAKAHRHVFMVYKSTDQRALEEAAGSFTRREGSCDLLAVVLKRLSVSPGELSIAFTIDDEGAARYNGRLGALWSRVMDGRNTEDDSLQHRRSPASIMRLFRHNFGTAPTTTVFGHLTVVTDTPDATRSIECTHTKLPEGVELMTREDTAMYPPDAFDDRLWRTPDELCALRLLHTEAAAALLPGCLRAWRAARVIQRWARMCLYDTRFKKGRRHALGLWRQMEEGV